MQMAVSVKKDCSTPEILLPHHTFLLCLMLLSTIWAPGKAEQTLKVPIYPVNQSLNQPLVEPFENNLKQNSSIKWLFQHTLRIILDHLSESANSAPKEIFWIYSVNIVIAKISILTTRNWEHFLSPIFNFNFSISLKHVILIDTPKLMMPDNTAVVLFNKLSRYSFFQKTWSKLWYTGTSRIL